MATFAQHATVGIYHLETRYSGPNRWEWMAFKKGRREAWFAGDSTTREGAKKAATASVWLDAGQVHWEDIGPPIETSRADAKNRQRTF